MAEKIRILLQKIPSQGSRAGSIKQFAVGIAEFAVGHQSALLENRPHFSIKTGMIILMTAGWHRNAFPFRRNHVEDFRIIGHHHRHIVLFLYAMQKSVVRYGTADKKNFRFPINQSPPRRLTGGRGIKLFMSGGKRRRITPVCRHRMGGVPGTDHPRLCQILEILITSLRK